MTVTDAHAAPKTARDVPKAGAELRRKLPNLSDAQVRKGLVDAGFPADAVDRWLAGEEPEKGAQTPPETDQGKKSSPAPRADTAGAGGGSLSFTGGGTTSGLLLALIAYPPFLAYLRGGTPGIKAWWKAKFLNQTSTDPGIKAEPWSSLQHATGGATVTSLFGNTHRKAGQAAPPASGGSGTGVGAAVVAYARAQVGIPYEWGGDGPAKGDKGFDCSGLAQAAWASVGVKIPRTTYLELAALPHVGRKNLQPGDLVYPDPGHVQIYAGGGQIIEAPRLGLNVRVSRLGVVMAVCRPGYKRPKSKGTLV